MRTPTTDLVLLPSLARHADLGLLLLRIVTGAFLIYQSHDNIFSAGRMTEFEKFLTQFGFIYPAFMAPFAVWWQFLAGIGFIVGLFTRWFGIATMVQFIVAVWMVHWTQDFVGWWPALILVFLGLYFGLRGSGRYGLDAIIERRQRRGPRESSPDTIREPLGNYGFVPRADPLI